MKVIGFTGNYDVVDETPRSYLMADSSLLFSGRPFFVPDFAQRFVVTPTIAVRTGRLGKGIAPKFAHRYWDAMTAAFSVCACDSDTPQLLALDRAFDGAAIMGDWVTVDGLDDPMQQVVEVMIDDQVISRHCLADMRWPLDDMIAGISSRCSIKMGDIIITGETSRPTTIVPGNHLTATIGGRQVLNVKVRL